MLNKSKAYKFFDQVKQEAKKVIWPDRKELVFSVGIVFVAVFIFSILSMILDFSIHGFVGFLLNIGK